ncbi:DNA primase [Pusillimonas sp. NJUB218]|uniref:DNA primase n=1 Tax=Pusillimonas sp. NJUB218 TaxID=2023230 RepID=UPI000F4B9B8D|nr:DNA primase [Pusillimonas sp. NJUB218]ROT46265.1 DNA primase [Pusillimonas sp. NJUB218]
MIPESFVQDLLARVDIVDVVGRYVQLRKGGANLLGLCPFHNEKSPSFTVSPTKQFYHCFGCGAHGTAISFLIEHTGASFPEAVRSLAANVGLVVPEAQRSPQAQAASRRRKEEVSRHQQLLDTAQQHYLKLLKATPAATDYLKKRGLTGEIAARFGLGWSGTDRRGLAQVFSHYEDPLLVEAGLVIEAEDGRRYDRFRERVMFPIRNARGNLIGFGGRVIGKGEPKYLNSPDTPIFSKGQELYGLWEGRTGIRAEGCVLVVEGYMDVVGLAQLGLENAVATLGTSTTPQHVQKLLRASDRIIFSFDGDKAGRRAAWRALQNCLPLLRDDISIRFLFLPDDHDPDSFVRANGAEAFRELMAGAPALSSFMLEELASRHNMTEPEGRAACVHEAKPLLGQLPAGTTVRLQIEREFARRVLMTPEELTALLDAARPDVVEPGVQAAGAPSGVVRQGGDNDFGSVPLSEDGWVPDFEPAGYGEPPGWAFDDAPAFTVAQSGSARQTDAGKPSQRAPFAGSKRQSFGQQGRSPLKRQRPGIAGGGNRSVTSMAKRLLRLLLAHPELADTLGDQQLETLARGPHLSLVRDLIALISATGARHVGALLEAADPDSDLAAVLSDLTTDVLGHDDLPDPVAEWHDAMHKVELDVIKTEQLQLVAAGLKDDSARERYQLLARRLAQLTQA